MIFNYDTSYGIKVEYCPSPSVSVGEGEKAHSNALPLIPANGNRSVYFFDGENIDIDFKVLDSGYTHIVVGESAYALSEVTHDGIVTVTIPTDYTWTGLQLYARLETWDENENVLYRSASCEFCIHGELEPDAWSFENSWGGTGLAIYVESSIFRPVALITADGDTVPLNAWSVDFMDDLSCSAVLASAPLGNEATLVCQSKEYGIQATAIITWGGEIQESISPGR